MNVYEWIAAMPSGKLIWGCKTKEYWKHIFTRADKECEPTFERVSRYVTRPIPDPNWEINWPPMMETVEVYDERKVRPSQTIRELRWNNHRRLHPKSNIYGDRVDAWLAERMAELAQDLAYTDNFRQALMSSRADMHRYHRMEKNGCCGSTSKVVTYVDWFGLRKRDFIIGCNYGH